MRTIILIFILLVQTLKSQTIITGQLKGKNTSSPFHYSSVQIVSGDSIFKNNISTIDSAGTFALVVPDLIKIDLLVRYELCGHILIKDIQVKSNSVNNLGVLNLNLDDRHETCPINKNDKVIPIYRGQIGSKKILKAVEKGEAILGGSLLTDCDAQYHCVRHGIPFL